MGKSRWLEHLLIDRFDSSNPHRSKIPEAEPLVCFCSAGFGSRLLLQERFRETAADSRQPSSGRLHLPGFGLWSSTPPGTCRSLSQIHFVVSEPRKQPKRVGTTSHKIIAVSCLNTDLEHLRPQISLFLDLLKCLCSDLTQDQFVGEDRAGCSSVSGPNGATVRSGRSELWRILRGAPLSLGQHVLIHFLFPARVKLGHGKFF